MVEDPKVYLFVAEKYIMMAIFVSKLQG